MRNLYCISGLGADERVFQRLQVEGFRLNFLRWLDPIGNEPIEDYSKRMTSQVEDRAPLLMGVSFGGMMALEMSKHIPTEKIILVSSIKTRKELPQWMKFSGRLRLNRLAPQRPWQWMSPVENHFLGTEGWEEEQIARSFRENIDPRYLRWALKQILNWQNQFQPSRLYQIHGSADKTFPIKKVRATHIVKGGGHFMVMNRASEISGILQEILADK
jgi:pimeloyl-ACP methyl ester carboxylesterase